MVLKEHAGSSAARLCELVPVGDVVGPVSIAVPGFRFTWAFLQPNSSWHELELRGAMSRYFLVAFTEAEADSAVVAERALCRVRPVEVVGPPLAESRGICVVASGITGLTGIERHFAELAARGWTVIITWTDPLRTTRTARQARLRTTPLGPEELARLVDDEMAEDTFVTEAVLRGLVREEPILADRPLVLVGASLGALGLPASAARIDMVRQAEGPVVPRVSAAVLIGGGAGVGDLLLGSSMGRQMLQLAGVDINRTEIEALRVLLDTQCTLSPERCLWALDGRPILLIDAGFDAIVPRRTADRLWRELGRPERWSYYPVGHIGLFFLVGKGEWQRAVRWVEDRGRELEG